MRQVPARLPIHVRIGRHETAESYLRRLLDANFVGSPAEGSLRFWASRQGAKRDGPRLLIDVLVGVPSARFDESGERTAGVRRDHWCARCLLGMKEQFECRVCARGAVIAQRPHADGFVCEQHRLWVGPHTPTAAQPAVRDAVVRAHRHWRHMRGRGSISVATTAELMAVMRRSFIARDVRLPDAELFLLAVQIWSELLRAGNLRFVTAPSTPFPAAYDRVRQCVIAAVGDDDAVVVDGVWLLVRPIAFYRRAQLDGRQCDGQWDQHFGVAPAVDKPSVGPLQPFARFNEQLRTCARRRWQDFLLRSFAPTDEPYLREDITRGAGFESSFICPRGHRFKVVVLGLHDIHKSRWEGCSFCSRRRVEPGVTSLDITHPDLARHWAYDLNDGITPRDVLFGTTGLYVWRCDAGHTYRSSVNSQTRAEANGCPYCTGQRAWPGETGIDPVRPDMLARWDFERNTISPDHVRPHSGAEFWWLCPKGHSYHSTASAVADHRGCGVCRGRQIVAGVNDLASQRPDIAEQWHPTRNGNRRPEDVYVSTQSQAWWRCAEGHEWQTEVAKRTVEGQGCRACAFERSKIKAGVNSFADVFPDLAAQWHPFLNGDLLPTQIGQGNHQPVWWLCPNGHTFQRGTAVRVRKPQCGYCINKWVLPGVNDVATRYPQIVADWSTRNRPAIVTLPGNARRHWCCDSGHSAFETVPNRLKTRGCPKCPPALRAANLPLQPGLPSKQFVEVIRTLHLPPDTAARARQRQEDSTRYPDPMTRRPRATPAELAPEPWPDRPSEDPVAEAVRQFVVRLKAEIGERSVRSVAAMAGVDQNALRRLLLGMTWPDLATLARLELALQADLWARPDDR